MKKKIGNAMLGMLTFLVGVAALSTPAGGQTPNAYTEPANDIVYGPTVIAIIYWMGGLALFALILIGLQTYFSPEKTRDRAIAHGIRDLERNFSDPEEPNLNGDWGSPEFHRF